jgi:hypothetical protein
MRENPPNVVGMCARTCWHALGGDRGDPPAWDAASANVVYDKVKASKRFWTTDPPRGALVIWKYGAHGHVAISLGNGRIMTTDPSGRPGKTGEEPITYPHKWGASASARIWTDQYNGVRFPVATDDEGEDDMPSADDIAKAIWKTDFIESPAGKGSTNPNWTAGSYLRELYLQFKRMESRLAAIEAKLSK